MMHRNAPFWIVTATLSGLMLASATLIALQEAARAVAPEERRTHSSAGDVVINEVAWMGTAASYTDEWIELYNRSATPILLDNWRLVADDGSPDILLQGILPAGGFFLLERSDDTTVHDIPADQVYTGALENDPNAESLSLLDAQNDLIDRVNGDGGGWPAGDNDAKQTMERIDPSADGSDENWVANDGVRRNGLDAAGHAINGTPRAPNSATVGPGMRGADIVAGKSGPATALPGGLVTYTLRVANSGALTATSVRLTDRLPALVSFVTQTSAARFSRDGSTLVWEIGDLSPQASPSLISVTGRISETAQGSIRNLITATTVTTDLFPANNHALWETAVSASPPQEGVRISGLMYEGYQTGDLDEAIQLTNVGSGEVDLGNWRVCDAVGGGQCATIVSGTLGPHESVWLAYWASAFYTSSGQYPAYAVKGLAEGVLALSGSWPGFANDGDEAALYATDNQLADVLVYEGGETSVSGWNGLAVEPWLVGNEGSKGYILYRKLDEASGRPIPDTDSVADWAQDSTDPMHGRRARYPGWDVERFFQTLVVTEHAHLEVAVTPDNGADLLLNAFQKAQQRIEISVYSLRNPVIMEKLIEKASAGVTVTVLLEGDPAGTSKIDPRWYQEMWVCQALYGTGHGGCWFMINEPEARLFDRYSFMHAKYALIDREWVVIASQNLTERGLPVDDVSNGTLGSRGVLVLTDAPSIVHRTAQVFDHDLDPAHHADVRAWSPQGIEYGPPPPGFAPVLSVTDYTTYSVVFSAALTLEGEFPFELFTAPEAALRQSDALLGLLNRAGKGDEVYVEALDERAHWGADPMSDPNPRMETLLAAARRGARVRILLNSGWFDAEYYDVAHNVAAVDYANLIARQEGLNLIAACGDPTQYGIHSKMVLVWLDEIGGIAQLGSLNGSETASKTNRELAIQIESDDVYDYLKRVFDWDWYHSQPVYIPLVTRGWSPPAPAVSYPVISEALYNPTGGEDGGEWVELYNPTSGAVDLTGWLLGDVGPNGEFGSGLYSFPSGSVLEAGRTLLVGRQAEDVVGFRPDFEFVVDPMRDDTSVPNLAPAGAWDGFGFALGNSGDEVILLDNEATPVDVLVFGSGNYPGVIPHPGVTAPGHSLERRPAIYDSDDCGQDFVERFPPDPGGISEE